MKALIILLITLTSTITIAQNTITWKGGTPGKETSWNEAKNWSDNKVPDENSYVIIKNINSGHQAQPVIKDVATVASIQIESGSTLTIEKNAEVVIDGAYNYTEGITLYGGQLINKGAIYLYSLAEDISEESLNKINNTGFVFVDDKLRDSKLDTLESKGQIAKRN